MSQKNYDSYDLFRKIASVSCFVVSEGHGGYIKHQAEALTQFLPCLAGVRFMRHWAGLADMTPDMAPIMDGNDQVEGFFMDCGWGYFGFKSCSAVGKFMAEFIAEDEKPDILKPFTLRRYERHQLMGETAALVNYTPDN